MLVAGVDDAGRGSAIGPLVIAGVLMNKNDLPKLAHLGVKDSKLLTPYKREVLAPQVRRIAVNCALIKLSPKEIDDVVLNGRKLRRLNWLEAKTMAEIIQQLKPDEAYVDASDILEDRFGQDILNCLPRKIPLVSKHQADRIYPIVSAASILAKVERDCDIRLIASIHGDFGSGYPSDPRTMDFLRTILKTEEEYPDYVRKSWKPVKKVKDERGSSQKRLM